MQFWLKTKILCFRFHQDCSKSHSPLANVLVFLKKEVLSSLKAGGLLVCATDTAFSPCQTNSMSAVVCKSEQEIQKRNQEDRARKLERGTQPAQLENLSYVRSGTIVKFRKITRLHGSRKPLDLCFLSGFYAKCLEILESPPKVRVQNWNPKHVKTVAGSFHSQLSISREQFCVSMGK